MGSTSSARAFFCDVFNQYNSTCLTRSLPDPFCLQRGFKLRRVGIGTSTEPLGRTVLFGSLAELSGEFRQDLRGQGRAWLAR